MGAQDPRVDAYIEKAAEFARPILSHLREVIHAASPKVDETMKWSFPHFTHQGILCSMAAFKEHCAFGFWKESLILKGDDAPKQGAMGQFGRITCLSDLPPRKILVGYVRAAIKLNEEGVKAPKTQAPKREAKAKLPEALRIALNKHPRAKAAFAKLSPSHRREYVEWIAEAKREETRDRRISTAIEWITQGKSRNWKYHKST